MNPLLPRLLLRAVHLVFSVPIIGYVYSPFEKLPGYASTVRYVAVPIIVVSGLGMWTLGRSLARRSARLAPPTSTAAP